MENEKNVETRQSELIEKLAETNARLLDLTKCVNAHDNYDSAARTADEVCEGVRYTLRENGTYESFDERIKQETSGEVDCKKYFEQMRERYTSAAEEALKSGVTKTMMWMADETELSDSVKKSIDELVKNDPEKNKAITAVNDEKSKSLLNAKTYYAEILGIESKKHDHGLDQPAIDKINERINESERKYSLKKPFAYTPSSDEKVITNELVKEYEGSMNNIETQNGNDFKDGLKRAVSNMNAYMSNYIKRKENSNYSEYKELKGQYMSEVENTFIPEKFEEIAIDDSKMQPANEILADISISLDKFHGYKPDIKTDAKTITIENVSETPYSRNERDADPFAEKATVKIGLPATKENPAGYAYLKVNSNDFYSDDNDGLKGNITLPVSESGKINIHVPVSKDSKDLKAVEIDAEELKTLHEKYTDETVRIENVKTSKDFEKRNGKDTEKGVYVEVSKTADNPEGRIYLNVQSESYHPNENNTKKRTGEIEIPAHQEITVGIRNPYVGGYALKNMRGEEIKKAHDEYTSEIEKNKTAEIITPQITEIPMPDGKKTNEPLQVAPAKFTETKTEENTKAAPLSPDEPKTITIEDVMETRSSREKGLENPESKATVRIGIPATKKNPEGYAFLNIDRKNFQPEKQNGANNGKGSITLPANSDVYVRTQNGDSGDYKTLKVKTDELKELHERYMTETVTIESVRETKSSKETGENYENPKMVVKIGVPKTDNNPEGCVYLTTKRKNFSPDENKAEKRIGDIEIPAHRTINVAVRRSDGKGYTSKILRGEELKKMHDEYMSQRENEKWAKSTDISKQKNEQLTFDDVYDDMGK